MLNLRDQFILGKLLVELDHQVDSLDRAVFEAAYDPLVHKDLDAQRERAMSSEFQCAQKTYRDRQLEYRNCIARVLGFPEHLAHDFAPRGYIVESGEFLRLA